MSNTLPNAMNKTLFLNFTFSGFKSTKEEEKSLCEIVLLVLSSELHSGIKTTWTKSQRVPRGKQSIPSNRDSESERTKSKF